MKRRSFPVGSLRWLVVCCLVTLGSAKLFAVSMNFNGTFRSEADFYNKLNLGNGNGNDTKTFISGRALLQPDLVIDDHFNVKSQWSLLTSPNLTPNATIPLGVGQGGYVFGDPNTSYLVLSRVWLEWTSDFGVFRAGRMPFSWGYGMIWDAGEGVWDDFQTTLDRLEYRLHLGHLVGALAYSKPRKLSVIANDNDADFYSAFIQYNNPESQVEAGILYEKEVRSDSQASAYNVQSANGPNPYNTPTVVLPSRNPPLSIDTPWAANNNTVDIYIKKTVDYFNFGGEFGWLSGSAFDINGNTQASLNAFGMTANVAYEYHAFKAFLDFLYASGDAYLGQGHVNGFVILNRNRRPGLILGRELLGPYYGNNVASGGLTFYGNPGSFSGVLYFRPGIRFDWTNSLSTGLEVIVAQKAAVQAGEARNLGVEVDLGAEYAIYKNFTVGADLGYLFAGAGLQVNNPTGAFGGRTSASVKF